MRRLALFLVTGGLALAACSGPPATAPLDRTTPPTAGPSFGPSASCSANLTFPQLRTNLAGIFVAGSVDGRVAVERLDEIKRNLDAGAERSVESNTFELVNYILGKFREGVLIASDAVVTQVINDIFCFAGINISISNTGDSWVVFPTDVDRVLVTTSGLAGVSLPPAAVSEPTVVSIAAIDASTFPVGVGPLSTKLDQYPLYYDFDKGNVGGTNFLVPVTVGICPASGIDPVVEARLRLGHDAATGFELPPVQPITFLDCTSAPPLPASSAMRALRWVGDLASAAFLPPDLHAMIRGGIGGSVTEFSPFGAVDPRLKTVGGIGGSVTEFAPGIETGPAAICASVEAPIGTPLPAECRPEIQVLTNLGTLFTNVPVSYTVTAGGGTIAAENGATCGPFSAAIVVPTGTDGKARACWTMGLTPGANSVEGRPGIGGDAVAGVEFSPKAFGFNAIANPPEKLGFVVQPIGATAGQAILPPPKVAIQDKNGVTVLASNATITVALTSGALTAGSGTVITAVNGLATFPNLVTTNAGSRSLVATSPGLTSATSAAFTVTPDAPAQLIKLAGDNQLVAPGTTVPIPPSVKLVDQFGNGIDARTIIFLAQNAAATVTGGTQTTAGGGIATVGSWKVLEGTNLMTVFLQGNPLLNTTFTATGGGVTTVLNSCARSTTADPVSFPFWIPGSAKNIRQVELYLSSNGSGTTPKTYQVALKARIDSYGSSVVATSIVDVPLLGKVNEFRATQFRFSTPIVSGVGTKVAFEFTILSNPDGATVSYNTGPCALGTGCAPPTNCNATEVTGTTPLPLGTVRRKSVGIKVLGS